MTDCEFIKFCEEAFGATVPGCKDDHWRGCPNYDLCVRVHNKAIEAVVERLNEYIKLNGLSFIQPLQIAFEALRKPSQEEK